MNQEFFSSIALLLVLLNPFMMTVYLLDLVREMTSAQLAHTLARAGIISGVVFSVFAWAGDAVFERVLQVNFGSFLIFGGIIFLVIAVRAMVFGARLMTELRGEPAHVAGAVAMPFMIGPGTVSASILAGARLPVHVAVAAISSALVVVVLGILGLKWLHDVVQTRNEALVERYVDIVGRATTVVIGTIAVDMIFRGVQLWLTHFAEGA